MKQETREKLEAIIRNDIEGMSLKYRDLRAMHMYSMKYKDMTEEEIENLFSEFELQVNADDIEWSQTEI
jgi:hypothetical protein